MLKTRPAPDPSKFAGLKLPEPTVPHFLDASKAVADPVKLNLLRMKATKGAGASKEYQTANEQSEKDLTDLYNKILSGDTEEEKEQKKQIKIPRNLEHTEEIDPTEYLKGETDAKGKETRADVDPAEPAVPQRQTTNRRHREDIATHRHFPRRRPGRDRGKAQGCRRGGSSGGRRRTEGLRIRS